MSQRITPSGPVYQELVACLREIADVSRKHKDKTASYQALGMEVLARRMLDRVNKKSAHPIPVIYGDTVLCSCDNCCWERVNRILNTPATDYFSQSSDQVNKSDYK